MGIMGLEAGRPIKDHLDHTRLLNQIHFQDIAHMG
jgi:hypothetical protein